MNLDLKEKRAFVCGSTQGIGKAIAMELAELGASITLIARNEQRLTEVCNSLSTNQGQRHDFIVADFDKPDNLEEALSDYVKPQMQISILVNNTGGPAGGLAINANTDEFMLAFKRHLICNQLLTKAVVPTMKSNGYGRIINVISTSVKAPLSGLGVSNTIRGAVASWSKTLATELAPFGITVNNVLPGATNTGRLDSIIMNKAEKSGQPKEKVIEEMQKEIPAGRFASVEEVAAVAAFLASPSASYINGINVPVDGGRLGCL